MTAPHLVLAHGFTQTARSWDVMRTHLTEALGDASFAAVDLPGHGEAAELRGDLWSAADHLVDAGGRGTYVGYSMGGRVALHGALAHPEAIVAPKGIYGLLQQWRPLQFFPVRRRLVDEQGAPV